MAEKVSRKGVAATVRASLPCTLEGWFPTRNYWGAVADPHVRPESCCTGWSSGWCAGVNAIGRRLVRWGGSVLIPEGQSSSLACDVVHAPHGRQPIERQCAQQVDLPIDLLTGQDLERIESV